MYMSVVVSVVFGWILLLAVTFAIPSTAGRARADQRLHPGGALDLGESMGRHWAEVLLFICVVAQFFCVTASTTSASRMMFAFSRDRAVPGHTLWRRVSRTASPCARSSASSSSLRSSWCPAIWNYCVGYFVGTAIAVIGLYIAFIIPMYLRWRLGTLGRAAGVEPREALQVDRHRSLSSGSP